MKRKSFIFLLILGTIAISACSTSRKTSEEKGSEKSSAQAFLHDIEQVRDTFLTLELEGSVFLDSPGFTGSGRYKMRILKDSIIWARITKIGFEVARLKITADSLVYINRLQQQFIAGSIEELPEVIPGLKPQYADLQNLILGDAPLQNVLIPPIQMKNDTLNLNARPIDIKGVLKLQYLYPFKKILNMQGAGENGFVLDLNHADFRTVAKIHDLPLKREYRLSDGLADYQLRMGIETLNVNENLSFPIVVPDHYTLMPW